MSKFRCMCENCIDDGQAEDCFELPCHKSTGIARAAVAYRAAVRKDLETFSKIESLLMELGRGKESNDADL